VADSSRTTRAAAATSFADRQTQGESAYPKAAGAAAASQAALPTSCLVSRESGVDQCKATIRDVNPASHSRASRAARSTVAPRATCTGNCGGTAEGQASAAEDPREAANCSSPQPTDSPLTAGTAHRGVFLQSGSCQGKASAGEIDPAARCRSARSSGASGPTSLAMSSASTGSTSAARPSDSQVRAEGIILQQNRSTRCVDCTSSR